MARRRKWKKGDVLVPRLPWPPKNPRELRVKVLEVRKKGYYVDTNGKSREEIEFKYLEDSYISENGSRVYTWVLANQEGEKDGKAHSDSDQRPRRKKRRSPASDSNLQEDSVDGPVRQRSRRATDSSSDDQSNGKRSRPVRRRKDQA